MRDIYIKDPDGEPEYDGRKTTRNMRKTKSSGTGKCQHCIGK